MRTKLILYHNLAVLLISSVYLGCTGIRLEHIAGISKGRKIASTPVLGSGINPDRGGVGVVGSSGGVGGTGGVGSGTIGVGGSPGEVSHMGGSVPPEEGLPFLPVEYRCATYSIEGRLVNAKNVLVKIMSRATENLVCEFSDPNLKDSIFASKKIDLDSLVGHCPHALSAGNYSISLSSDSLLRDSNLKFRGLSPELIVEFTQLNLQIDGSSTSGWVGYFNVRASGDIVSQQNQSMMILSDYNPNQTWGSAKPPYPEFQLQVRPDIECDKLGSPLIIQMDYSPIPKPINLTSQSQGIFFDILGKFSVPTPHSPKKISWLTSHKYFFLALPNSQGQVNGIDELFGNNTTGPDGRGADNGYLALEKYDQNKDGLITAADPIFKKLRVWQDQNFNGKAESPELYSLKEANITAIDLAYDSRYSESDKYGNRTMMKSVVKTKDGRLHLIFDLWFKYF